MENAGKQVSVLSEVAAEIQNKLEQYYNEAIAKSVYANAAILDPRIKLNFLKNEVS